MTNNLQSQGQNQFEHDVTWCLKEIEKHYANEPYWEETLVCHFSRTPHDNAQEVYWKEVNKEATKRYVSVCSESSLDHKDAYRELNRMMILLLNIISGNLIDASEEYKNSLELKNILTISHKLWQQRAPSTLQQHDALLQESQKCLNLFEEMTNSPFTLFTYYTENMNNLRCSVEKITHDNSIK